jgi:hypothetical protein
MMSPTRYRFSDSVTREEIEQELGLAAARAEMNVGDEYAAVPERGDKGVHRIRQFACGHSASISDDCMNAISQCPRKTAQETDRERENSLK